MSHYDTLGVPRDATQAQIKRAFRKAAMHAHPDRDGGSPERMAKVNAAYEQLGDEVRRKVYDETGADAPLNQDTTPAEMMVMQALQAVIDSCLPSQLLKAATQMIERGVSGAHQQMAACETAIRRAKEMRAKVKGPTGRNLVHMILDTRVEQASAQLLAGKRQLETATEARKIINGYRMDEEGNLQRTTRVLSSGPFSATLPEDGAFLGWPGAR